MPVSTRSQISSTTVDSEESRAPILRNPHHGLKEKMKALTLLYEQQQKKLGLAPLLHAPTTHHPSLKLLDSNLKNREDKLQEEKKVELPFKPLAKKPIAFTRTDAKENQEVNIPDHVGVYSCPKKSTEPALSTRKLSMGGAGAMSEGMVVKSKKVEAALAMEDRENGSSRILVFVRLRPMSKKEREAGAKSCVKIVNCREVYLTGFAIQSDYLRLKRIQGRHFCFDASFPETTVQQEVYSTT